MIVYLAGEGGLPWVKDDFYGFYRLDSYLSAKKNPQNYSKYKGFILDSGIFTYLTSKKKENIDWDKYATEYAYFVKNNQIGNYVEIDIDTKIGLDGVEMLRRKIEKIVGRKCMPVWHTNRGYDEWLKICKEYDYVCFGSFITDGLKTTKYNYIKKFLQDAKKEKCKVHGLGMTSMKWVKELKFHSVDSSSWTSGCRYGSLHYFNKDKIENTTRPEGMRIKDTYNLGRHNFYQWVKFSEYAERNY